MVVVVAESLDAALEFVQRRAKAEEDGTGAWEGWVDALEQIRDKDPEILEAPNAALVRGGG